MVKEMVNHEVEGADALLEKWEGAYKKGLLSFWMLLLLNERPSYAYEMSAAVNEVSKGTVTAEENSIYRALRRFEGMGIIKGEMKPSDVGPERKYYHLTERGKFLLAQFIRRNLLVFSTEEVKERMQAALQNSKPGD